MSRNAWVAAATVAALAVAGGAVALGSGDSSSEDAGAPLDPAPIESPAPSVDAGGGEFCDQIAELDAYYATVRPEDAATLEFLKRNRELLGSVTDLPPALSAQWTVNLNQQDEVIAKMEAAGATTVLDAPPEVLDAAMAMGPFAQVISSTVSSTCGTTLEFGG